MTPHDWSWLVVNAILIGWLIWLVRRPIVMPEDRITDGPRTDEFMEGRHGTDQDHP